MKYCLEVEEVQFDDKQVLEEDTMEQEHLVLVHD